MRVQLPEKLGFLFEPHRYKVIYGGRGSSKSWSVARTLLIKGHAEPLRVLCTREVQKSIKDSVYRLLCDQIDALGLAEHYEVLKTEIRHRRNGTVFLFAGLADHTADSLKSYEGIDICWVEEAQTVSERSWALLIPTIRKAGSEIWVTFNPDLESDPTYQRFVVKTPPDAYVVRMNWPDNPWFPEVLRKEKDYLYATDTEAAEHVWGGHCRKNSSAQILKNLSVETFEPRPDLWDGPYHGLDFGFANDPLVFVRCWIWEGCLYLEYDLNAVELPITQTAAFLSELPQAADYLIRADCARPEMINHLVREGGFKRMQPAYKWDGSLKDGVDFLRSFHRIVIHPRCKLAQLEGRLYSYKVDKLTGDVLPVIVDKHNNVWDAVRYAIEPVILAGLKKQPPQREEPKEYDPINDGYAYKAWGGRRTGWMGG